MLNLIKEQNDIGKIYLYAKYFSEVLSEKRKDVGIKHLNDPNAFIECSNTIDDVYKNIDDYNLNRKIKVFMIFWWYDCRHYESQKISSRN